MDVAQYLGVFLLENDVCYLHGIGNLEVRKTPAGYNNDEEAVNPETHEIIFSRTAGSIDDAFANFIATHERVSISNAANQIKDFVQQSLDEMRAGNEVNLPGLGKFFMDSAEIQFKKDENLHIKGKSIPFFQIRESAERKTNDSIEDIFERTEIKELKAGEELVIKPPKVNWPRIILIILIFLVVLGVLGYFGYKYLNNNDTPNVNQTETAVTEPVETIETITQEEVEPTEVEQEVIQAPAGKARIAIASNVTEDRANARSSQLNSFGHDTAVKDMGDGTFSVIMTVDRNGLNDAELVDSIKVLFGGNPKIAN